VSWFHKIKDRIQGKAPKGAKRSSAWRRVRREHLREFPHCFVCGSGDLVEVHHIIPFHIAPDMELDPTNLISLCEGGRFKALNCHLLIGHLADYREVNPSCKLDAMTWREKLKR
jgi:5-methylcytosine-specific restriction protein A